MDYNKSCSSSSGASVTPSNNNNKEKKKKVVKKTQGLSTDPQSVAARARRHRISDRFKTLQSLVPGGNKMDTVSMLEEAIQYVKFLKTQIWLHQTVMSSSSLQDTSEHDPSPSVFYQSSSFPAIVQSQVPLTFPPCLSGFQGDDHHNMLPRNY